jgi:hypothetical protein
VNIVLDVMRDGRPHFLGDQQRFLSQVCDRHAFQPGEPMTGWVLGMRNRPGPQVTGS